MGSYVVVGSQDPFNGGGRRAFELAGSLADHGDEVTVFLVQNGVLGCRRDSAAAAEVGALASRTRTIADGFSLRERGITPDEVVGGVETAEIDSLVGAAMVDGTKVLWT